MKLKKPENSNYCFTVVKVGKDIPLENRDRIVHKSIFGNLVITGKDSLPEGSLALYIPVECQLSEEYCYNNNLYDVKELNIDKEAKGYIGYKKRRVKALKLGGHESNGMLMPLESLGFIKVDVKDAHALIKEILVEGTEFDTINDIELCRKYVPAPSRNANPGGKQPKQPKGISKLVDNQFRFHIDTTQLGKSIYKINPNDIVSITEKLHGTSGISSKVLVRRRLNILEKMLKRLGVKIQTEEYDNEGIYASRKVVKNEYLNKGTVDWYKETVDWRKIAHESVFPHLTEGMTAYYEIVGYTPGGAMIQKGFDYGYMNPVDDKAETLEVYQENRHFGVYIYRLTYTSLGGNVHELSARQVQEWCKSRGLKAVPELYYGKVCDIEQNLTPVYNDENGNLLEENLPLWRDELLEQLKRIYWHKQCKICKSKVPNEGIVLRKEGLGLEAYKYKNFDFLIHEGKQLDKGETNVEDNN